MLEGELEKVVPASMAEYVKADMQRTAGVKRTTVGEGSSTEKKDWEVRSGKWNSRKTEMTTNKCASTIAEEKHGDFAEQNHVNASPRSYFPCLCTHLLRNDVDSQTPCC